MRIDKVGVYRTSNGQKVVVNGVFSGRTFGCIIDDGGFVKSSYWYCVDGSHPTQSDLRIVSEWVVPRQPDDDLRQQHEQTIELLRQRIDAAVKTLEGITRCEIYPDDYTGVISERNEHGEWVQWDDVKDVIEILTGNIPTNLEGSE